MANQKQKFDFSGWATRFDVKCSDGRTIRKNAFKHNDGQTVPLVWNHNHQAADNILGHALLENREEGVYAYCSFNDTMDGKTAKELVKHGDIRSLSIYANQLKQNGGDVIHGAIREVSLVLAGANPGAVIENVMIHGELNSEAANIRIDDQQTFELDVEKEIIEHADNTSEDEENEEDLEHADNKDPKPDKDDKKEPGDKTVEEVIDSMNEEQKTVMYALIGAALEDKDSDAKEKTQEENKEMKQNAFDQNMTANENVLSHSDMLAAITTAKQIGSLKEALTQTCLAHGIQNIEVLFPDFKAVKAPSTVDDSNNNWVKKVMARVHHSPFARVKSNYFDVTGEDARARGYIKGNQKVEEVIAAFKRTTDPQTIYKLQKLDRDDIIDIVDFDVVAYIKAEMRTKLEREIARAILIGDGRPASSNDKINPLHIRPILGDDPVYTIAKTMVRASGEDEYKFSKRFIKTFIKSRKEYKGSGNMALYCTEDLLTDMLLIEDRNERVIYDTLDKLKTALMVTDIVTIPDFENQIREVGGKRLKLMGIFVNLADYNVGADKGGAVSLFDDFDLNFNKYEYLIETRCSGALVEPYSAITFEEELAEEEETQTNN